MADEIEVTVQQDGAQAEPVPTTEVIEAPEGGEQSEAAAEAVAEAEAEPEKPKPKVKTWAEKRIDEVTKHRRDAERREEQATARANAAEALIEAMRRGEATPETIQPQSVPVTEVEKRAAEIADARAYRGKVETTIQAGATEFPDFNDNCSVLADLGANERPEFMQIVTDTDNGHKVLQHLGQNPEEADRILRLPAHKMAMEIARLSDRVAKPKVVPVSAAPAPIKPIDGRARGEGDPNSMSDADFDKWYGKHLTSMRSR